MVAKIFDIVVTVLFVSLLVLSPNLFETSCENFEIVIIDCRSSKAGIVELTGERYFVFYVIVMVLGMSLIISLNIFFFKKLDNSLFLYIIL